MACGDAPPQCQRCAAIALVTKLQLRARGAALVPLPDSKVLDFDAPARVRAADMETRTGSRNRSALVREWRPYLPADIRVARRQPPEVRLCLLEAHAVGATSQIDVVELQVVVFPSAHRADEEGAWWLVGQREVAAAWTWKSRAGRRHRLDFTRRHGACAFAWERARSRPRPHSSFCLIAIATIVERSPIGSSCAADVIPTQRGATGRAGWRFWSVRAVVTYPSCTLGLAFQPRPASSHFKAAAPGRTELRPVTCPGLSPTNSKGADPLLACVLGMPVLVAGRVGVRVRKPSGEAPSETTNGAIEAIALRRRTGADRSSRRTGRSARRATAPELAALP
jgi:hypothetical protein